jgi:hypothetical protein
MKHLKRFNQINENLFHSIKNSSYIKEIDNLLQNGSSVDMINFLKSIIDKTKFGKNVSTYSDRVSRELELLTNNDTKLIKLLKELKTRLKDTSIQNIRIYPPSSMSRSWIVSDIDLSFGG